MPIGIVRDVGDAIPPRGWYLAAAGQALAVEPNLSVEWQKAPRHHEGDGGARLVRGQASGQSISSYERGVSRPRRRPRDALTGCGRWGWVLAR